MITFLGVSLTYEGLIFLALFITSELIALNPALKDNSICQFIIRFATIAKYGRKEDDQLEEIREILRGGRR